MSGGWFARLLGAPRATPRLGARPSSVEIEAFLVAELRVGGWVGATSPEFAEAVGRMPAGPHGIPAASVFVALSRLEDRGAVRHRVEPARRHGGRVRRWFACEGGGRRARAGPTPSAGRATAR